MNMRTAMFILVPIFAAHTGLAQTSPHGKLQLPCQTCHTTDSWKVRSDGAFDHATTGFSLEGQHKSASCISCHKELKFTGTPQRCVSCHIDVHKAELGANCSRCHAQQSWKITDMVQRHQLTRFPLLGRHATLACQDCHAAKTLYQYVGTPIACVGCHRVDYEKTSNPNHAAAGFSTYCAQCHRGNAFLWGTGFDHTLTRFPLTGAHLSAPCALCHKGASFRNISMDCFSCHQSNYQSTLDPNHTAAKFPTVCQTCHSTSAWRPSVFSHDNTTFPLTGAHRAVACRDCHVNNQYVALTTNCLDCHRTAWANTTNPNHQTAGFPQNCVQCHTTTAWRPASFDHNATKFPLTGAHAAKQCQACHVNSNYQLVYTDCYQCHQPDFARPTNPNHVVANFSHQCLTCHTTTAWKPSTFDHDKQYFKIYSGTHRGRWTQCADCHASPASYTVFSCTNCHEHIQSNTDGRHRGVNGYVYSATSCYSCHKGA
jgi:hypothetical protein